jgi:hypothetical protein
MMFTVLGGWDGDTAVPVGAVEGDLTVYGGDEGPFDQGLWSTAVDAPTGHAACDLAVRAMEATLATSDDDDDEGV